MWLLLKFKWREVFRRNSRHFLYTRLGISLQEKFEALPIPIQMYHLTADHFSNHTSKGMYRRTRFISRLTRHLPPVAHWEHEDTLTEPEIRQAIQMLWANGHSLRYIAHISRQPLSYVVSQIGGHTRQSLLEIVDPSAKITARRRRLASTYRLAVKWVYTQCRGIVSATH